MEPRARIRTLLRRAGISAALAALLVPAAAGTASAAHHKHHRKHHSKLPVVTSVRPLDVSIGQTLTVRGRNFRRGIDKNTVAFKRSGARVVFVKARLATTKMLKVVLPDTLASALRARNGAIVPTRLKIRVLAKRFGKRYTRSAISPLVSPRRPPHVTPPVAAASGDCDGDGLKNSVDTDDDNDLLPDTVEARIGTDPCKADTDGDGVTDGYEYQSAVDLNNDEYGGHLAITPAPVKRPYPNPLFADQNTDYDGDGLSMLTEYRLWAAYRNPATGLSHMIYSDGNQYSAYVSNHGVPGALVGADPVAKYRGFISWAQGAGFWNVFVDGKSVQLDDMNRDGTVSSSEANWYDSAPLGKLSDDERDEDGDGLSNWDETSGRMQPSWWAGCYSQEKAYPVAFGGTDPTDPDTDGDLIRDGADDQDHDGIPNLQELSRTAANGFGLQGTACKPTQNAQPDADSSGQSYVNPFNPCLPFYSKTCERHPAFDDLPAGLDPETKLFILN